MISLKIILKILLYLLGPLTILYSIVAIITLPITDSHHPDLISYIMLHVVILIGGLITCGLSLVVHRNLLFSRSEIITESRANMASTLARRARMLKQLSGIAEQYVNHEDAVFNKIVSDSDNPSEINEQISTGIEIQDRLYAIARQYPELKANSTYQELMSSLHSIEDKVQEYRITYNQSVKDYNLEQGSFPNVILSRIIKRKKESYLQHDEANNLTMS